MGVNFLSNFIAGAAVGYADTQTKQMLQREQQTGAALDKMLETALAQGDAPSVQALMPMLSKRYGKASGGFVEAAQRKWTALQQMEETKQQNAMAILNGIMGGGGDEFALPTPGPGMRRAPTTGRITGPVSLAPAGAMMPPSARAGGSLGAMTTGFTDSPTAPAAAPTPTVPTTPAAAPAPTAAEIAPAPFTPRREPIEMRSVTQEPYIEEPPSPQGIRGIYSHPDRPRYPPSSLSRLDAPEPGGSEPQGTVPTVTRVGPAAGYSTVGQRPQRITEESPARMPASETAELVKRADTEVAAATTTPVGRDTGPRHLDDDYAKDYFRQYVLGRIKGLQPGMSATIKVSPEVSITLNGNERAVAQTRKFLAVGQRVGVSPLAMRDILTEAGLPVQEAQLTGYGDAVAARTYRALLPAFAEAMGAKVTDPAVQRAAALETFQRTGYKHDKLPSPWTTDAEAEREATRGVHEAILAGTPVIQALENARLMHTAPSAESEASILRAEYGKTYTGVVQRGGSPEHAAYLAGAAVNFDPRVVNEERLKMTFPEPPLEGATKEQAYIQGAGRRPSPQQAGEARAAARQLEVGQKEATAAASKRGELQPPERVPTTERDKITAVRDAVDVARRVAQLYRPSYVGLGQQTIGGLLEQVGGKTPGESKFRAEVNRLKQAIIHAEAGLSQTNRETINVELFVPLLRLPATAFIPRMEALIADQMARAKNIAQGLKESNVMAPDLSDFTEFNFTRQAFNARFTELMQDKQYGGDKAKVHQAMKAEGW
jgi:hypothetical protein